MSPHVGQGVSMALEDVFLLSRVLELESFASSSSLSAAFDKFDEIQRPRVERFAKLAASRLRKKTGSREQWLKKLLFWAGLKAIKWTSLDRGRFGEGDLVYDVDEIQESVPVSGSLHLFNSSGFIYGPCILTPLQIACRKTTWLIKIAKCFLNALHQFECLRAVLLHNSSKRLSPAIIL
ncbi:uncharacterized protein Z519_04669 [Cladophialophora bantiana CBS 173.52]|uniref:FAD-binding domain-containing protein n=1 Tax=Cladophialophora bantiana (strain ATCC 10958 / CBS 173.52 / CDC B-1940 / NIH 8579) TaxID=1442370 RepID=A0A0D2G7S2_CLAB1|nr:uncharacterized protein Z519_04669 [Cladophialophora bantiana CBS 173.52]KIW94692.1 hypothetical protein Z519_04669 [Cladophialophora bantiana CBS 173.52]